MKTFSISEWWTNLRFGYKPSELAEMKVLEQAYVTAHLGEIVNSRYKMRDGSKLPEKYLDPDIKVDLPSHTFDDLLQQSELKGVLEDMIGYICEYQHQRAERLTGNGKKYDPTNMFCSEVIEWIMGLSSNSVESETTKVEIENRIKFLKILEGSGAFIPGSSDYTRLNLFMKLKQCLTERALPIVELGLSRKSSREIIKDIKIQIRDMLKQHIAFLYYCYRNSKCQTSNFILEQLVKPDIESYKVSQNTVTGKILAKLLKSTDLQKVFNDLTERKHGLIHKSVKSQKFVGQIDHEVITLDKEWYQDKNSGIHPTFHSEKLSRAFLWHHILIIRLAKIHSRFDKLFDLAGEGGNLLIYGCAIKNVDRMISDFKDLNDELLKNLSTLNDIRQTVHNTIVRENRSKSWKYGDFFANSIAAEKKYDSIVRLNKGCEHSINELEIQSKVPLQHRIEKVLQLMDDIDGEENDYNNYLAELEQVNSKVADDVHRLYNLKEDKFLESHQKALALASGSRLQALAAPATSIDFSSKKEFVKMKQAIEYEPEPVNLFWRN